MDPKTMGLISTGKKLVEKGFVTSKEGNISIKNKNMVIITSSGCPLDEIRPENLVRLELNTLKPFDEDFIPSCGVLVPSLEWRMHIAVYQTREDVQAIIHTHPPHSTSYSTRGSNLDQPILPEVVLYLGPVPLVPYAPPGSTKLAKNVANLAKKCDALLLENHGAITLGTTLEEATHKLQLLESFAMLLLTPSPKGLGPPRPLPPGEVKTLVEMRKKLGLKGRWLPYPEEWET